MGDVRPQNTKKTPYTVQSEPGILSEGTLGFRLIFLYKVIHGVFSGNES